MAKKSEYNSMNLGLERMQKLLNHLDDPQNKFLSIHVAGTNGKGTVCRYLHYFLRKNGLKVGLFTSPHLINKEERFQINEALISKKDFEKYKAKILRHWLKIKNEQEILTIFELYTAIAFKYFADQKVDIAVLETGLGGRLDATNIVYPKATVITNIGLDHCEVLGNSIEKIAFEKAGIIKENIPLIAGINPNKKVNEIISKLAKAKKAKVFWLKNDANLDIAKKTLEILEYKTNFKLDNFINHSRQELIKFNDSKILLDGAHNQEGALFLTKYLQKKFKNIKIIFLIAILKRKDSKAILKILEKKADKFFFTEINDSFTANKLALLVDPKKVISANKNLNYTFKQALSYLGKQKNSLLCVCGSLYFTGKILKLIKKNQKTKVPFKPASKL